MEVIRQAQWLIIWEHYKDGWLSFTYFKMGYVFSKKTNLNGEFMQKISIYFNRTEIATVVSKQMKELVVAPNPESAKHY